MPTQEVGFSFVAAKCIKMCTILFSCFCAIRHTDAKLYKNRYNFVQKPSVLPIDGRNSKCYLVSSDFFLKRGMHDDEYRICNCIRFCDFPARYYSENLI